MKKETYQLFKPLLFIVLFSFLLIFPQWVTKGVIFGADSIFHYNRFYEAAMQIKNWNYSYFISIYGFQQSGRIVNAVYGPFFAYFQGLLVLLGRSWFGYQLLSRFVLGVIAGLSMYKLLKAAKIKDEISIPIALLYLTTFSIQYWTMRQGFTSWGAAFLPYCFIPAIRFTFYKEVHPIQLAVSVALIFQVHLLSTLFLIIMYIPFFVYGFFQTQKKLKVIGQGLLSVGLALLLTANVWLALLFLRMENRLLDPFINGLMDNNAINTGSSYWIITPYPLVLFLIGQIIYLVVRWRNMAKWKRILHSVYLLFIMLSTTLVPWKWMVDRGIKFAELIQFPFRFFIPATILLLLIGAMTLNRFVKWRKLSCWILTIFALIGAIQASVDTYQQAKIAEKHHYVLRSSLHVHTAGTYQEQRQAVFDSNLDLLLQKIRKSTPDYVPVYNSIKGYNTYNLYAEKVIFKEGFTKVVNNDGSLSLTWDSDGGQTELPVVVYKKTKLILNQQVLKNYELKLSTFGNPTVTSKQGVNKLTISFTVPVYFTFALWVTILTWLGLVLYWLYYRIKGYDFQVLHSE
ncbi:hypothetical protein ACVR0S_02790 [Streptococcus dentapri]|uniref:Major facilitator superfamily permease n=1 Tax=Streptococcus dentapri TaxID=573564 RepID=A0ABV8D1Q6_9STRE